MTPEKDVTEALQVDIGVAIRATTYTSTEYDAPFWYDAAADFFEALPNEVVRSNVAVGALVAHDCSGCDCPQPENCGDGWTAYDLGGGVSGANILSFVDGVMTVESVTQGATEMMCISSGDANACCYISNITVISGGYDTFIDWINCGSAPVVGNLNFGFYNGQCTNSIAAWWNGAKFQMELTFQDCP